MVIFPPATLDVRSALIRWLFPVVLNSPLPVEGAGFIV